jgi:hypothetical protein
VLEKEPDKRAKIEEIYDHPWFNINPFKKEKGIIVGYNKIPVSSSLACIANFMYLR